MYPRHGRLASLAMALSANPGVSSNYRKKIVKAKTKFDVIRIERAKEKRARKNAKRLSEKSAWYQHGKAV